jgi:hypothetical protein
MKKITLFSLIFCFVTILNLSSQNVVYVASDGVGSGTSWSDPMGDIASAVEDAGDNGEVWVKGGVYNITAEIVVQGVKVYGGFAGTETAVGERAISSADEPWSFTNPSVVNGDNSIRIFLANHAASLIDGFTIANGGGLSSYLSGLGGGVMISNGAQVNNCIIKNNKCGNNDGGGVAILGGTLSNSLVENNTTAVASGNRRGGGIFTNPGSTSTATITNCVVRNNIATAGTQGGGAFAIYGSGVTSVVNCQIYNNQSLRADGTTLYEGAAAYFNSTNPNSKMVNNLIYNNKGLTVIAAVNNAKYYNNTIVNNTGFIYPGSATVAYYWYNNIIWGNTNSSGASAGIAGQDASTNIYLNNNYMDIVRDYPNLAAGNNVVSTAAPNFVLPTSFVGVATSQADTTALYAANFSLQSTSPCRDMGMTIAEVTTDIEGNTRPMGTAYDAGAYEFDPDKIMEGKVFELYDAIPYQGKPDLRMEKLLPINLIYEGGLTKPDPSTVDGKVLDYDKINELAELAAILQHVTVSTDIEHWFGDSSVDEQEMSDRFISLFARFRNYNPNVFIGNYGIAPSALCVYRFYDGGKKDEATLLRDWRNSNKKRFASLGAVDVVMPSVYIAEPNIDSWKSDLQTTVEEIRKYTTKKIFVYIWPQYYDKPDSPFFREFVDPEIWGQMLEAIYLHCDGAIIWSGTKDKDGNIVHWNDSRVQDFWNETKKFITKYRNNIKTPEAEPELIFLDNSNKTFKIFNAITYNNSPDLKQYGLSDFKVLSETQVTGQLVNGIYEPDSAKIANIALSLLNTPDIPVGVKANSWIKDRATNNEAMIARHKVFKRVFRRHNPFNPIGFFNTTPSALSGLRVTNSNTLINQSNWIINAVMSTRILREQVDVLLPASYIIDNDTVIWKREFYLTVKEARKNNPAKPVYAHFYVDYFNQSINFINAYKPINDKSVFRCMLEAAFKICDGVVLNNISTQTWNNDYGFWIATLEFLEAHKDNLNITTDLNNEIISTDNEKLSVFPNPANQNVYVIVDNKKGFSEIEIFDVYGNVLDKQKLHDNETTINIQSFSKGVYFVRYKEFVNKLIIQ